MTAKRFLGRFGKISLGLFGFSLFMASCAKEKTCVCSYTYGGMSEDVFEFTSKSKDDCEDMEVEFFNEDVDCSEK